jgi:hypothetical protein
LNSGWGQRPLPRRRLPALLLVVSSTAALSASAGIVQAVEECRLEPGVAAPSGSKWLSRIDRDHRRCWFLSSSGGHRPQPRRSASLRNRHLADGTDAGQQDKKRDSDLQMASAPISKPDVVVPAESPAVSQVATLSGERSSDNLIPHSIPTIAYMALPSSAQTLLGPTAFTASTVQPTPPSTSDSNLVVLAGAAGLLFAGGVFHFRRRGQLRSPAALCR